MTLNELVENHIKNNNIKAAPSQFINEINAFGEKKGNYIARQGDVLFLYSKKQNSMNFTMVNGGGSVSYLKSVRTFVKKMQEIGIKELTIRVQDKQSSQAIARSVGAVHVKFEETNKGETDPYTLYMEI